MIKMKPVQAFGVIALIWVGAIGGLWAYHEHQLTHGREIVLKTVPVDPRDMFRGEYVILNYDISMVSAANAQGGISDVDYFRRNQTAYAYLIEDAGVYKLTALKTKPPQSGLFLRGRIMNQDGGQVYRVEYGIESFFLPEGQGKVYEEARNSNRLYAVLSVSPHGVAMLKRLEIR